ncbi:hypothetical protein Tco_1503803 [Tanacetum coccineum]
MEEAYYTQFGAPYQPRGQYRAVGPGFYQQNNGNSLYPDQRPSLEESLTKFMAESAKWHEENSNISSKVLQERGFGSRPSSTEMNPQDQVKSISTAKADFSEIHCFTIIDDDDMTKDVVLGMKFCKKCASCQRIMKRFALGNNSE